MPVADQKMLLNLWHSFIKSLSGYARKSTRPIFMQLAAVQHAQKITL
jgi:hypothetical protein